MSSQQAFTCEKMEADSTTPDTTSTDFPFPVSPENFQLYKSFAITTHCQSLEKHIVQKLRTYGLLPALVACKTRKPDCKMMFRNDSSSRDRVVWLCEGCKSRQSIRRNSFFNMMGASLLQVLQLILAWSEDIHPEMAAQYFDTTQKVACVVFSKLDRMAIMEQQRQPLGGPNSVVLVDIYPDCVARVTPDTTQKKPIHVHKILMMADTKHVPTHYILRVIEDDDDDQPSSSTNPEENLKAKILQEVSRVTRPNSTLVTGPTVPNIGGHTMAHLEQRCSPDMRKFLTIGIWRRALKLCDAARDICFRHKYPKCVTPMQNYLNIACFRSPRDHLFAAALQLISNDQRAFDADPVRQRLQF